MDKEEQFSIGEFSDKTGVSIRTLHYYDEIGLLTPLKHPTTGHRIYRKEDILSLQKIVSFKFLGYSLEQIMEMVRLSQFDSGLLESLRMQKGLFEEKKAHIESALKAVNRNDKAAGEGGAD
ncbi:MerR family transcriptional regulator [Paenibacillus caui]|uniref:MerR family transcriptional regulator n=1 Tax=Paenibacillus caui TaxID=2873927 RepID=UPI003080E132